MKSLNRITLIAAVLALGSLFSCNDKTEEISPEQTTQIFTNRNTLIYGDEEIENKNFSLDISLASPVQNPFFNPEHEMSLKDGQSLFIFENLSSKVIKNKETLSSSSMSVKIDVFSNLDLEIELYKFYDVLINGTNVSERPKDLIYYPEFEFDRYTSALKSERSEKVLLNVTLTTHNDTHGERIYVSRQPGFFNEIDPDSEIDNFQTNSSFSVNSVTKLDDHAFTHLVEGVFNCELYSVNDEDDMIEIKNATFRLPFSTEEYEDIVKSLNE